VINFNLSDTGDCLYLNGELTFASVPQLMHSLAPDKLQKLDSVDVSLLSKADSAGVACLLWIRNLIPDTQPLKLLNVSSQLKSLIEITGVSALLCVD
jgi:ABC-type transporter Mla MlaB component